MEGFTLSKKDRCLPTINRIDTKFMSTTCDLETYVYTYKDQLELLLTNQFQWEGKYWSATNRLTSDIIEGFFYQYGKVCFYIDDVMHNLMALPCVVQNWDTYGVPSVVDVYSPYNTYRQRLDFRKTRFVVVYDCSNKKRSAGNLYPFIRQIANISLTIDINCLLQRTPILTLSDANNGLSIDNFIMEFVGGLPVIKLKGGSMENALDTKMKALDLKAPYVVDKLETERRNLWNMVLESIGYKVNINSTKKERQITDEVGGNLEETIGFYCARSEMRKRGIMQIAELLDFELSLKENTEVDTSIIGQNGGLNGSIYNDNQRDM